MEYTKENPLRCFFAFAGYDSQAMALDRLKEEFPEFDYECIGWSEIDKYAIQAHNAVYPQYAERNYGDISKIDWSKVPDFDLFTYSFPCGLKGTRVKTLMGYKDISEVSLGDKVLTHKGRYMEVIRTMYRLCPDYYRIKATGCDLHLTAEHPLYVLRDGEEMWVKVKDLLHTDMISYCIPTRILPCGLSSQYLWLLGRYVADGWINPKHYHSVAFAIAHRKEEEFKANTPVDLLAKAKPYNKTAIEYRIADEELQSWCYSFGSGAKNKVIPNWLLLSTREEIKAFLAGYFSGDGHLRKKGDTDVQMFTTASKDLFLGIQRLLMKVYGKVCSLSVRKDSRRETFSDTYNGQIAYTNVTRQIVRGYRIFTPLKSIEHIIEDVQVYNLEVNGDNSYTCDNVNTHNCTDISLAGQQKGLSEESGTRSALLWECKKAIEAKHPKYLLMENVKPLVGKKFFPEFQKWLHYLHFQGYDSFYKVLNAADYGVPQRRERVFMISILGDDAHYEFPKPMELNVTLADILEKEVDESYYISDDIVEAFLDKVQDKSLLDGYEAD